MKATVESFKEQGADGFVFGILHDAHDSEHQQSPVDIARNKALVELADGRPCTFHRAFDLIPDSQWDRTLGSIIDCGFKSILTSGGPSGTSAIECTDLLRQLIHKRDIIPGEAAGSPYPYFPQIIVGGGVRSTNAAEIAQSTGATAVHSAALTRAGETVDRSEVRALRATLDQLATKP